MKIICPRCREEGYLQADERGERVYYYCRHPMQDGGSRKFRKCYLGPKQYHYVEMANPIGLAGHIDPKRLKRYLITLIDALPPSDFEELALYVLNRLSPKQRLSE